jgi:signal transduction histidine kinase
MDFSIRLKNKAINSATLLFSVKGITGSLLKIIDDRTVTNMNDVTVIILDKNKKVIYSNRDSKDIPKVLPYFRMLNWEKNERHYEKRTLYICFQRYYNNERYYVLASASDLFGQVELKKLLIITSIAFLISIFLIILAGYFNAKQSVKPVKSLIRQIDEINASSLSERLTISTHDEIAELSATFNNMLERIEQAFENERMFVSNVSHELRTPVTSIIGQLEVALLKQRNEKEYEILAQSVLEDMKKLKTIINGFLDLAESRIDDVQNIFTRLRIDELLFSVKEEILKHSVNYQILVEFENLPDDENDVMISGNERLLKMLLSNLIDNSCKFSDSHKVVIRIAFNSSAVTLRFIDQGIGIPEEDIGHIFEPLYRARNVTSKDGHGIGLSIVKRIVDMHSARIDILSEVNIGTTISVSFPVAGGPSRVHMNETHDKSPKVIPLKLNGIFRFKFRRDCSTYK